MLQQVQGSVVVDLSISDQAFQQKVILANSEGILGINFLGLGTFTSAWSQFGDSAH